MKLFPHPPFDDVALRAEARGALADLAGLPELTRARGVDFATAALYEWACAHPVHGAFKRRIDAARLPMAEAGRQSVVVIPGLVWEDHPELGADGALVMEAARRLGFGVQRVPVKGRATLEENAARIVQALDALELRNAWLVTLSKGAADLGYAIRTRGSALPWHKLAGWINVCGSPNGADLAACMTATPRRRLAARALCLATRIPFQAMREIASSHAVWALPLHLPASFRVVSVVGMPLRWHLPARMEKEHRKLAPLGPNDGVVLCANALVDRGPVYPLWGYDHYFRGPRIVPLLYRLLGWIRAQAQSTEREPYEKTA